MSRTTRVCVGSLYHSPVYSETDSHHTFPLYMSALLGVPERKEMVILCATHHDEIHHVLRHLVNEGHPGGHRLAAGLHRLAMEAWTWWQDSVTGAA